MNELIGSMSASELTMWMAFDRVSPIGDVRGDIQTAQIVSSLYGAQGAKVSLKDALLRWGEESESNDMSSLEVFLLSIS